MDKESSKFKQYRQTDAAVWSLLLNSEKKSQKCGGWFSKGKSNGVMIKVNERELNQIAAFKRKGKPKMCCLA